METIIAFKHSVWIGIVLMCFIRVKRGTLRKVLGRRLYKEFVEFEKLLRHVKLNLP